MSNARESHLLARQTVLVQPAVEHQNLVDGAEFTIIDWYENVNGVPWLDDLGVIAVSNYALRVRGSDGALPWEDNDVLYGKIGGLGYLVHVSELRVPTDD